MHIKKTPSLPKALGLGLVSTLIAFTGSLVGEESAVEATVAPAPAANYSEADLFGALGQYMALSGAVADLQFSDAEVDQFAKAVAEPMVTPDLFSGIDEAEVQAGIDSAIARLDALEAGEEAPALLPNAATMVGYVVAMQSGIVGIEISSEEGELIEAGAKVGSHMSEPTPELMGKMEALSAMIEGRIQSAMAAQQQASGPGASGGGASEQRAAGEAYLAALAESEPDLQTTDSGLRFIVQEPGDDTRPAMSDTVRVHYHGTLIDGSVFDSSVQRGQPADFPLQGVVPGFAEGLQQVGEGGKVRLFIPANLAYGDTARPGSPIPGGALIIFDCELIAINP